MPKFKPGDVVLYAEGNGEAIVNDPAYARPGYVKLQAWRSTGATHGWVLGAGQVTLSTCKPHPDADEIWRQYVAWRLLNG